MKVLYKIMSIITFILTISVYWIGSIGVHIYTITTVYQDYGIFWGIISFFCPVISQIVLFIIKIVNYGISNTFCIVIIIYVVCIVVTFLMTLITSLLEGKGKKEN